MFLMKGVGVVGSVLTPAVSQRCLISGCFRLLPVVLCNDIMCLRGLAVQEMLRSTNKALEPCELKLPCGGPLISHQLSTLWVSDSKTCGGYPTQATNQRKAYEGIISIPDPTVVQFIPLGIGGTVARPKKLCQKAGSGR